MGEQIYPRVIASSEKYRIVQVSESKYSLDEWDDDRTDAMGKILPSEWRTIREIDLGTDCGVCRDDPFEPFIEIMENGWTHSGVEAP